MMLYAENNLQHNNTTMYMNYSEYNQTVRENDSYVLERGGDPNKEYDQLYRWVSVVLTIFIFVVGMLGNMLVIAVVIRTRSMHTPTNCYLLSLAFADCIVLLFATFPAIAEPFFQENEWPFGPAMLSVLVFGQYLSMDVSAMSVTALTVERYIGICHPIRAQTICTVRRAKRIIAGIWIFGVVYCLPWLFLTVIKEIPRGNAMVEVTDFKLERDQYAIYFTTDFVLFYVLPLLIAVILYGLIARALFTTTIVRNGCSRTEGGQRQVSSRNQIRVVYEECMYGKNYGDDIIV